VLDRLVESRKQSALEIAEEAEEPDPEPKARTVRGV
jgi:hypothetical protein